MFPDLLSSLVELGSFVLVCSVGVLVLIFSILITCKLRHNADVGASKGDFSNFSRYLIIITPNLSRLQILIFNAHSSSSASKLVIGYQMDTHAFSRQ